MAQIDNLEAQLRRAILDAPMSCNQLAIRSGVSRGIISRFVNQERSLTLVTAGKLAVVLGLSLQPAEANEKER